MRSRHLRAGRGGSGSGIAAALLALLLACGDDDGVSPDPDREAEERIGPAGGVLEAPNDDARVVVPAGALDGETLLTVRQLRDGEVPDALVNRRPVSDVYRFGPDDLTFEVPVMVEIFFDDENLPPGVGLEDVTIVKLEETGDIVELANVRLLNVGRGGIALQARRGVGGQVSAFSPFAVVPDETPGSPPVVLGVEFPATHSNDPGSETLGTIEFADADGDVRRVVVEEILDPNDAFTPFAFDIDDPDLAGATEGTIGFRLFCPAGATPCTTGTVTARVVLEDAAGGRSEPAEFSFEIVD